MSKAARKSKTELRVVSENEAEKSAAERNQASHDTSTPQALIDFMLGDWQPRTVGHVLPVPGLEQFAARREALSGRFPHDTMVVPTGHEKVRANDTFYRFRPSSDFYYLTGNTEPDCVLVMSPRPGGGHESVLFVEPGGRQDASFFTDRNAGELWVGPRLGVEASRARFGADRCRSLRELSDFLAALSSHKASGRTLRVLRGSSPQVDQAFEAAETDVQFAEALSEMRLLKDELEIRELRKAIGATRRAFDDVIRCLPLAASERYVEGVFNLRARVEGNDVGYGTIAAAGPHACTLHWTRNDGPLKAGDLMLLDAGVEAETLYTADITRTLPLSGHFTGEQRTIYDLVFRAQRAAMAAVRPGVDFLEPNRVAMRILTAGLCELGILKVPAEEALREDRLLHKRYTLHNVSHMLGLDVHDCAQARKECYKLGKLAPGMVLTVEPGLYFQPDDLTVPPRLRGIGVRIEDDVLVTDNGCVNLSDSIPAAAEEVEAWMASFSVRKGASR